MEQEAAPPMGIPESPEAPNSLGSDKTNKHHFKMLKMNMNIEDDDFDDSMGLDVKPAYIDKEFNGVWVKPPIPVTFKPDPHTEGIYLVKFLLSEMPSGSFFYRNKINGKYVYKTYKGKMKDEIIPMSEDKLAEIIAGGYQTPQTGPMPPLGGM